MSTAKYITGLQYYEMDANARAFVNSNPDMPVAEAVHTIMSNRKYLTAVGNVGLVTENNKGTDVKGYVTTGNACHACNRYLPNDDRYTHFYTSAFPYHAASKEYKLKAAPAFVSFVCDKTVSPWRSILSSDKHDSEVIYDKEGMPISLHLFGEVQHLHKLVVHSLCVMLRQVEEKYKDIHVWYDLVNTHKIDPVSALYIIAHFCLNTTISKDKVLTPCMARAHWPFDSPRDNSFDLGMWREGKLNIPKGKYALNSGCSYTGCNALFNAHYRRSPLFTNLLKVMDSPRPVVVRTMFSKQASFTTSGLAYDLDKLYDIKLTDLVPKLYECGALDA